MIKYEDHTDVSEISELSEQYHLAYLALLRTFRVLAERSTEAAGVDDFDTVNDCILAIQKIMVL